MRTGTLLMTAFMLSACSTKPPPFEGPSPVGTGGPRAPELVEVVRLDPSIRIDVRYATADNFLGRPVYTTAAVFLQRPAAEAVMRAQARLRPQGYGLVLFDGYRPWAVTRIFWDATPEALRHFVANPATGSKHNRGCAVDLSLVDLATGRELEMPTPYDDFSEAAYADAPAGTPEQRERRRVLRDAMEAEGFRVYEYEWWHFDHASWPEYPIQDVRFEELRGAGR